MRIVKKKEFYRLPAGTIYSEYEPCAFNEIFIKGETINDQDGKPMDYVEMSLIGNVDAPSSGDLIDILDKAEETGESFSLDFDFFGRNASYEDAQLYAVYERKDLEGLISTLKESLSKLP